MAGAKLHYAEAERLAALRSYAILDTAPDPLFDRLIALAAHVCGTPIATLALVDADRQWFKATVGLGGVSQIPRDIAFASDAVAAAGPLVITDARADPRYADNPQVTGEPGIRAFVGMPLIAGDGLPLGALCVIDRQPRTFDARSLELLSVLADQVVLLLEARRPTEGLDPSPAVAAAPTRCSRRRRRRAAAGEHPGWRGRRLQTIASGCLAVALIGLSGVATWSGLVTGAAARTSQQSILLYDAYATALYWVEVEDSSASEYQLAPDANTSFAFSAAKTAVDSAMAIVTAQGPAAAGASAAEILRLNGRFADVAGRLFRAVDSHDTAGAAAMKEALVRPALNSVQSYAYAQALASRERDVAAGSRLTHVETIARWATLLAVAVGLLLIGMFIVLRQVFNRERQRQAARTAHQATHDLVTGLPNRVLFSRSLDRALVAAKHTRGRVGVILLNLDRLKDINNTLGHDTGDQVLKQVGRRIRGVLAGDEFLAHLGADEFAVMIPASSVNSLARGDLNAVASRVQSALATPFTVDEVILAVEATVGVASYPEDAETSQLLLQHVDIAMHHAKANNEAVAFYEPTFDSGTSRQLHLLADLWLAIGRNELVLHYQPLLDIASSRVKGAEALVRWQHPIEGLLAPGEFLPIAESSGFIHVLTRWVVTRAAHDAKGWADAGNALVVSVNVSARCLIDTDLPQKLSSILTLVGLPAHLMKLEITESAIITDPARARDVIERLHALGVALSIDDFGTGYTSLTYLRELPIQEIKIDQTFITHMLHQPKDEVIVRTAVELAARLGFDSVAEGIDDPAILTALANMGCTTGQGYYICRPLPAAELLPWTISWDRGNERRNPSEDLRRSGCALSCR